MKISVLDNYKLYGKCLHMTNDIIEVVATIDVGPRIVHFSFVDGTNVLHSDRDSFNPLTGKKFDEHYYKGAAWENLGGHRLWISPESLPETYYPDTDPIEYEIENNTNSNNRNKTINSMNTEFRLVKAINDIANNRSLDNVA